MTTKTNETRTVTPTNPANVREIEMMMGKAVCAWANWATRKNNEAERVQLYGEAQEMVYQTAHMSEYETTARCIAMFVEEPLWQVCSTIIETAKAEFGIDQVAI